MTDNSKYYPYSKENIPPLYTSKSKGVVESGDISKLETTPYHTHNGIDSPKIDGGNILNALTVSDGSTTVNNVGEIDFEGATVTDEGLGVITVEIDTNFTNWNFDGTFSTASGSVAWTAGTFYLKDGTTYSIIAGDTGDIINNVYIYLDTNVSTTEFQVTADAEDVVGDGKIHVGSAEHGTPISTGTDIFTDDFNSLSDGVLSGQGGWQAGLGAGLFNVEGTVVYEGAKAVKVTAGASGNIVARLGTARTAGVMTIYVRPESLAINQAVFQVYEEATDAGTFILMSTDAQGNVGFAYKVSGGAGIDFASSTVNTWNKLDIEWRSVPDKKVRYRANNGTWTSFLTQGTTPTWTTALDKILIGNGNSAGAIFYFDAIQADSIFEGAPFQIFGGRGGLAILDSNIIDASITSDKLDIDLLSDITPDLGAVTSGTLVGITGLALRDTSAAFDVTITPTSSPVLDAGRVLTLDVGNVAHTLVLGTTANTITFPNVSSDTVVMLTASQAITGKTYNGLTITTSVGTLTIPNNASAALITSGNFSITLTATGATSVTLPTSGTLAKTTDITITNAEANDSITPVADATYTFDKAVDNTIAITTVKGIVTNIVIT